MAGPARVPAAALQGCADWSDAARLRGTSCWHVHPGCGPEGKLLAVKRLATGALAAEEFTVAQQVGTHPNLCALLYYADDGPYPLLAYELPENGTLRADLQRPQRSDQPPLSWQQRLRLLSGVAHGLLHMHSRGRFHCDVNAANVGLDASWNAKLLDCGHGTVAVDPNQVHQLIGQRIDQPRHAPALRGVFVIFINCCCNVSTYRYEDLRYKQTEMRFDCHEEQAALPGARLHAPTSTELPAAAFVPPFPFPVLPPAPQPGTSASAHSQGPSTAEASAREIYSFGQLVLEVSGFCVVLFCAVEQARQRA